MIGEPRLNGGGSLRGVSVAARAVSDRADELELSGLARLVLGKVLVHLCTWSRWSRDLSAAELTRQLYARKAHRHPSHPHGYYQARVRAALVELDDAGLVDYRPGRGARPTTIGLTLSDRAHTHPVRAPDARFTVDNPADRAECDGSVTHPVRAPDARSDARAIRAHREPDVITHKHKQARARVRAMPADVSAAIASALVVADAARVTRARERAREPPDGLPAYHVPHYPPEAVSGPLRGSKHG